MKSALTIHKEILKEEYEKTELGRVEKKLRAFYRNNPNLPDEMLKQIDTIRTENEKKQQEYIDMTLKRDREAVDMLLLSSMKEELKILDSIENYNALQ